MVKQGVSDDQHPSQAADEAEAHPGSRQFLRDLVDAFLLGKRVGGCSERTVGVYRWWLDRVEAYVQAGPDALDSAAVARFFARLRERGLSASTLHQAYRTGGWFHGLRGVLAILIALLLIPAVVLWWSAVEIGSTIEVWCDDGALNWAGSQNFWLVTFSSVLALALLVWGDNLP